jgi:hypothetical protein
VETKIEHRAGVKRHRVFNKKFNTLHLTPQNIYLSNVTQKQDAAVRLQPLIALTGAEGAAVYGEIWHCKLQTKPNYPVDIRANYLSTYCMMSRTG